MPKTKQRPASAKTAAKKSPAKTAHESVPVDRRRKSERRADNRRKEVAEVAVERRQLERREKVVRRRQIDPTTCERDYTDEEIEFMNALDVYKRRNGRMFPTCSEILEVIRDLGYRKLATGESRREPSPVGEIEGPREG